MNSESPEERVEWTLKLRGDGNVVRRRTQQLVLVGARFKHPWLEQTKINTSELFFEGELGQSLNDLRAAARDASGVAGFALPITRLRASMLARIPGVISLDRDLGIVRPDQPRRAAATLYHWEEGTSKADGSGKSIVNNIAQCLKRWHHDVLDPWGNRCGSAGLAQRVLAAAQPANIRIAPVERGLFGRAPMQNRPDLPLIIRHVAERLVGEEVFRGLGPCELVLDAVGRDPGRSNTIDLMTAPMRPPGHDESFSMIVRLSAVTMPYSRDIFLKVAASKRVWASQPPGPKRNAPFGVRAYLIGPGRPIFTTSVERKAEQGWQFGEDYAEWISVSEQHLPATLKDAVANQSPDEFGWWAGLPQLTTLYDSVSARTVFEGDDLDLREAIIARLPDVVAPDIPFQTLSLPRRRASADVAMLKLSDLGLAGQALDESDEDEQEDDDAKTSDSVHPSEDAQRRTLQRHREQNVSALKEIHGSSRPALWSFCSSQRERELIEKSVEQLFGDAVQLHTELLPADTHGLREKLPGSTSKAPARFELRVQAWKPAAEAVKATPSARYVLICAADRENGRTEDPVNYYAGIHAMCQLGDANVHHVLPIGGGDPDKAVQNFVHRLQSALLDVFFAHSGMVFGTEEFLRPLFAQRLPTYIYGVQAMRSNARMYSGEIGVSFLLFTRLHVQKGTTDVRFVYRERRVTQQTPWLSFSEGLRWLGSQRALDSDELWLKTSTAEQVRFRLGEIAAEDPRAVILVDWSTMRSLWRGISDEDLTHGGGIPRIDNGKDVAAACPQMTLVRLRKGEDGIALRAKNTSMFERSGQRPGFSGLEATGEVYTEEYATTTKAVVAIVPSTPAPTGRPRGHYIQSMGYRKTVQILRGQSCYRTTQRMRMRKGARGVFELGIVDPSKQDAALPAPLEVTVMACPPDVSPDNVAIAVLGLRLGYIHYGDWTALPAPLFFKRKIEDYVVRYRSPASASADEHDEEEADAATTVGSSEAADPEGGEVAAIPEQATLPPMSKYLLQSVQEIVSPVSPVTSVQMRLEESEDASVEMAVDSEAGSPSPPAQIPDAELASAADVGVSDDRLLELVKALAQEDFALCGPPANFKRRQLYGRMMRGQIRVCVPVPFFVSAAGIFGGIPPTDRESLRRFWHGQHSSGWIKAKEQTPALAKLGSWIMRRLQIPQGGYSIYRASLFPRSSLFAAIREGWKQYVAEQKNKANLGESEEELSDSVVRLDEITEWAVSREDDELIAWLIFGCAHFPFISGVLDEVIPHLATPIGAMTREALHYFITCARATRAVVRAEPCTLSAGIVFSARPRPKNIVSSDGAGTLQDVEIGTAPPAAAVEHNSFHEPSSVPLASPAETSTAPISSEVLGATGQLNPGDEDFEARLQEIRRYLDLMEQEHRRVSQQRELARAAADRAAVDARTRAEHAARWNEIRSQAARLLDEMRAALPDTQTWRAEPAAEVDAPLENVQEELERLRLQIAAARSAQDEYETVADRATPSRNLTPRDAARHRAQWHDALQAAHETLESSLNALMNSVRCSHAFSWLEEAAGGARAPTVVSVADVDIVQPQADLVVPDPLHSAAAHADRTEPAPVAELREVFAGKAVEPAAMVTALAAPKSRNVEVAMPTCPVAEGDTQTPLTLHDGAMEELQPMPEPLAARERAEIVLQLLKMRAYATIEVYVQALQLDYNAGTISDHGLVVSAAIEAIRRMRTDVPPEQPQNAKLRARLEEDGPQMPECEPLVAGLGILAAGLGEMIFPRLEGSGRWTYIDYLRPRFAEYAPLHAFVEQVSSLEGFNIAQETLTAATIGARDAAQSNVDRMRRRAKHWASDEALYRKWTLSDYKSLHESLFRNEEFPIAKCLGLIARGEDQKLEEAYRDARKKLERPLTTIEDLGKRFGRRRSFDGVARGHIIANIERTHQFIKEYQEAVSRAKGLQAPVAANVRTMLQALYQTLCGAIEFVASLTFRDARGRMYRELAMTVLGELKRMFDCAAQERVIGDVEQMLLLRLPLGTDLRPSLLPQMDSAGNTVPAVVDPVDAIEEVESLAALLNDGGNESDQDAWIRKQLGRAGDDHLSHNRILPLRAIDRRLGRAGSRLSEQKQCLGMLVTDLQNERQRVTHAMALGALTQSEASRMLRLIEELLQAGRFLGEIDAAPVATPDFPHAYAAIRRLVTQPLESRLAESKAVFFKEVDQYVADNPSAPHLHGDVERIRALANERGASSIRAARDMFSLLKEGALPRKVSALQRTVAETYKEFVETLKHDVRSHHPLIESLILKLRGAPVEGDPQWLSSLEAADRQDALLFLESWEALCAGKSAREIEGPLTEFFRGMRAAEPSIVVQQSVSKSQRTEFILDNSMFAGLDRTVTGVFIPPALGSGASFIQGIVFRQRAADGTITQAIDERAQASPTFLLGRGSWTLEKRAALSRHRPVLLLDDDLVAFAAVHPHQRLQKLMQVALLTFNDNPYDDYGRPVPPEMFFGRRSELRRLRQVKTAAVLFGGRRLGKSSLLDQLERDAQGRSGEVVLYLTLDRADRGISEDHVYLAWDTILRKLVQNGVLSRPKHEPTKSAQIRRWIEDEIMAGRCKAKGIYLLIDEADELMGRDLHQRGPFISSLLGLVESVGNKCAIRFVIAGLHNLTRMASEENSPLGKFEPIALKPFWSTEDIQRGIELIKVPLEALGFYFASGKEDMPLRIMAVCNFYPAFIQLYCKKLIGHLYNRRDKHEPPTYITDVDLEAVELDKDFLSDIRSKFKLNMDLDKRYAAIALILADQYYRDGAKALTATEVRTLCDLIAAKHFETTGPGAYDSLLEEMEILTILERVGARYSLRTPNIAMMLGDRESVEHQLDTLGAEKPVQQRSRGELRSILVPPPKSSRDQRTFPMPSAWVRSIFKAATAEGRADGAMVDRDLLVLVGNELSGLFEISRLKGAWQIADTATLDVGLYPSSQVARTTLVRTARTAGGRATRSRRLHCVSSGSWTVADIPDYARLATALAAGTAAGAAESGSPPVTRLALIANASRAYEIAKLLQQDPGAEVTGWKVTAIPPWTDDALYYRLDGMEKPDLYNSDEARRALLLASCGFGGEIERLCGSLRTVKDALRAPAEAEQRLAPDLETFYRLIGMPPAIAPQEYKNAELLLRTLDGEVREIGSTEEFRVECSVSSALFLFLQWMGLLQEAPGGTWHVPGLYRRLLK